MGWKILDQENLKEKSVFLDEDYEPAPPQPVIIVLMIIGMMLLLLLQYVQVRLCIQIISNFLGCH